MAVFELGEKIKSEMEKQGVTAAELAGRIKVSKRAILYILNGDVDTSALTLSKICAALNMDANYLLGLKRC